MILLNGLVLKGSCVEKANTWCIHHVCLFLSKCVGACEHQIKMDYIPFKQWTRNIQMSKSCCVLHFSGLQHRRRGSTAGSSGTVIGWKLTTVSPSLAFHQLHPYCTAVVPLWLRGYHEARFTQSLGCFSGQKQFGGYFCASFSFDDLKRKQAVG